MTEKIEAPKKIPFFSEVKNPTYSKADNSAIDCVVTVNPELDHKHAGETHHFTATSHDTEIHGIQLWSDLITNKYGDIAPYVAKPLTPDALRHQAVIALQASDAIALKCYKNQIPWPKEWNVYDDALNAIIKSGTGIIPPQPALPAGI